MRCSTSDWSGWARSWLEFMALSIVGRIHSLVEHHPQHGGQLVILVLALVRLGTERPDVIRHNLLPAEAGLVKPLSAFESPIESVLVGVRRTGAVRGFGPRVVRASIPVRLGVEPVADIHQNDRKELEGPPSGSPSHQISRAQWPTIVGCVAVKLDRRAR